MTSNEDISGVLSAWAPRLADSLTSLSYLGSASSTHWLTDSALAAELRLLSGDDCHELAAEMWEGVLKRDLKLPAPALLLVLEHIRQKPSVVLPELQRRKLTVSRSVANLAFRAAESLYDDAKEAFARHEIDIAVARFRSALSEFRFAIESRLLSEKTMRLATGKYAAAVAMIGRWVSVSPDAVLRALGYSKETMLLGNRQPETLTYRLELLVLHFDQTGDAACLHNALQLLADNRSIAAGSELVEAEARYRLAMLSDNDSSEREHHLESAKSTLARTRQRGRGTVEEARCNVLTTMIAEAERGRSANPARLTAIPRGLLAHMATKPSPELWRAIRRVVKNLESLRKGGSVPAAVLCAGFLRQIVDGPADLLQQQDLFLYVEVTKWLNESAHYNRHVRWEAGAAALSAAKRSGRRELAKRAEEIFSLLTFLDPKWPLPKIGLARVRDYLAGRGGGNPNSSSSWQEAAKLALASPNYARSNLGGRNEVFAVTDARGFLSETFVFKRTTKAKAEHEASMLNALRLEIARYGYESVFEVPRSLAIVELPTLEDERKWVHVTQRSAGRLLSDVPPEEAAPLLESITDLLGIFHRIAGDPPEGKSAWRPLKEYLKMWSRALFEPEHADAFVASLRETFPSQLRLVRKRDGHASNWLVDPAGRIVAIDFESVEFIPAGYDVAQLIEDNAIVPPNAQGWRRRLDVMARYFSKMGYEVSDSAVVAAYGWFAITRALRLGTEKLAGKNLRRHAREICAMLEEYGDASAQRLARELLQALSRIDQAEPKESRPSHDHRRLSKAMARQLRHHGPESGLRVDRAGFASIEELALTLKVDSSHVLAVAEHPGEPRFEVRDGLIRALYGHSLDVRVDAGIKLDSPISLYHGSSWAALDSIVAEGLKPMSRRMVHLTNNANEAVAVGERKGAAILMSIDQSNDEEPVADGIWVARAIEPVRLSILNPFGEEAGVVQ